MSRDALERTLRRYPKTMAYLKGYDMTDSILQQGFKGQAASLRDFGYPDVTSEMVAKAHADWIAGKEPTDVIAMFCERAFEDHPQIFGKREQ